MQTITARPGHVEALQWDGLNGNDIISLTGGLVAPVLAGTTIAFGEQGLVFQPGEYAHQIQPGDVATRDMDTGFVGIARPEAFRSLYTRDGISTAPDGVSFALRPRELVAASYDGTPDSAAEIASWIGRDSARLQLDSLLIRADVWCRVPDGWTVTLDSEQGTVGLMSPRYRADWQA